MNKFFAWLASRLKRTKRFDGSTFSVEVVENSTFYLCPICGHRHGQAPIICEKCLYPLPLIGGSRPKE